LSAFTNDSRWRGDNLLVKLYLNNHPVKIGTTSLIYLGQRYRVRWMRYNHDFPAKTFLLGYEDDFAAFLARAEEMGDFGQMLKSKGHPLTGKRYREIYEFKMPSTRAFGFAHDGDFIVTNAAKKQDTVKRQTPDYERALTLRQDYLDNLDTDE
jgi:hypothetical protein